MVYLFWFPQLKLQMLESLRGKMFENDVMSPSQLKLQFCGTTTKVAAASSSLLPIMLHQCPENFSTIDYFEVRKWPACIKFLFYSILVNDLQNLSTKDLGRLVIYADVMTSSMDVVAGSTLYNGIAVIPRQQTIGAGNEYNFSFQVILRII